MIQIFIKRFILSLLTLAGVLLITFMLLHKVPGGPFDQERQLPPEIEHNLYKKYGLSKQENRNFFVWVAIDLKSYAQFLAKGQLGPSLKYRDRDVGPIIAKSILPSLELGILSFSLALILGILCSLWSVHRPGNTVDRVFATLSSLFVSLPGFVAAVLLVFIFSITLKVLPPALWEGPSSRVLPVLTLSLAPFAYFFQLTRASLTNQINQDYIRTAKSKGVTWTFILFKHALKNALGPTLTLTGPMVAYLVTGSFVVETIFAIPGMGKHFVTAVVDRDYFLVMGLTLVYATILISMNWLVDVGYRVLDPRLQK